MKQTIQVRMSEKDIHRLKKEADKTGHSVSFLARFIMLEYLKKQEK